MAKRLAIPSKELAVRVVGPTNSLFVPRVQRLNISKDIPVTNVDELGNSQHAGTVTDTPNVTVTFSVFDVSIKAFSALTGTDATAYPSEGVDISSLDEIDVVLYVKDQSLADYVKSSHARRLQIRDFSYSYSVDGESTEDYTAIGSQYRWFKNDVVVDRFTSGTTSFNLTETPIQLRDGDYLLSVVLDGEYLEEVVGAPSTGEYSVSGTTLTTGDSMVTQCIAVYHANPAGTNWSDVRDSDIPVAIRGKNVKIVINANDIPRVQSVTINGNLNPQPVREMGNTIIVGYQKQVPTVDGSITVLDTDTELISLLTEGQLDAGYTEYEVKDSCAVSGISLDIKLYDPCDTDTVLKTVYVPNIRLTGETYTQNVNDNAQQTFNFVSDTAQCVIYSGARA